MFKSILKLTAETLKLLTITAVIVLGTTELVKIMMF